MTAQLIPQHVPSEAQLLCAIQVIIDNRRHAQDAIRWNKFRAFIFVAIAFLATIAAAVHTKQPNNNAIVLGAFFGAKLIPGLILLAAPVVFWPHASSFPGSDSRNASWQLGLGNNEAQSLLTVITMQNKALKTELSQVDLSALAAACMCFLCTFQFVAAGFVILSH